MPARFTQAPTGHVKPTSAQTVEECPLRMNFNFPKLILHLPKITLTFPTNYKHLFTLVIVIYHPLRFYRSVVRRQTITATDQNGNTKRTQKWYKGCFQRNAMHASQAKCLRQI